MKMRRRLGWTLAVAGLVASLTGMSSADESQAKTSGRTDQPSAGAVPGQPLITNVAGEGLGILVDWSPSAAADAVASFGLTATPDIPNGQTVPAGCQGLAKMSAPGSDTTAVMTGVCGGVAYRVTVTATNATGTGASSLPSNPVVPLKATVPLVPLINAVLGRGHELIVSFSAPSYDGGGPVTGYRVTAAHKNQSKTVTAAPSAESATITGLTNGRTYQVTLRALNTVGPSPAAQSSGTPSQPGAPGVPQNLSALPGAASGSANVSWTPPTDDHGSPVLSYRLSSLEEVARKNGTSGIVYKPAPGAKLKTRRVTGTAVTLTGFSSKQIFYAFRVAATNARGTSTPTSWSQPITLRPSVKATTRVLSASTLAGLQSVSGGVLTIPINEESHHATGRGPREGRHRSLGLRCHCSAEGAQWPGEAVAGQTVRDLDAEAALRFAGHWRGGLRSGDQSHLSVAAVFQRLRPIRAGDRGVQGREFLDLIN